MPRGYTLVGSFSTEDPDDADVFSYTLVSGDGDTGNKNFYIAEMMVA